MLIEAFSQLDISNYSLSTSQGKFLVTGQIMSIDLLPEEILKRDIKKLLGKEARLEHAVPELEPYSIVGEVTRVWWDDQVNAPFAEVEVYDDSDITSGLREVLLDDQKLPLDQRTIRGFSIGILKYTDKEGKIKKILPREISFTEAPVCEECTISSVMRYNKMTENNSKILQEAFSGQLKGKDDIIASKEERISELNEKLRAEKAEFSATQQTLLDEIKAKTDLVAAKDDEIAQFNEKYSKLEEKLAEANKGKEMAEKAPLVEALLKIYSLDPESEAYSKKKESLFAKTPEVLQEKIDDFKIAIDLYAKQGGVQFGDITGTMDIAPKKGEKQESSQFSREKGTDSKGDKVNIVRLKPENVRDVM